jgi:hypothetical protein
MMQNMAAMGRYGDTQMAHVAPGEMVVPGPVLNANPGLRAGIMTAIGQQGVDPTRYMVGSPTGSYNPMTGRQEFFLPALFSAIGSLAASPFGQAAITSGITSLLSGSKPKDALRNALIGGITGGLGSAFFGGTPFGQAFGMGGEGGVETLTGGQTAAGKVVAPPPRPQNLVPSTSTRAAEQLAKLRGPTANPKLLGIGSFLYDAFPSMQGGKILDLLSSPVGEALAFSLGSGLLSKLGGKEEESMETQRARRPFGGTDEYIRLNIPQYAVGGMVNGQYFPRRNGGIMPHEGSGQKDDVPAMLMAGEFVLTKDAVKGLGNGDQERGIQKAYKLMDRLEEMA